MAILIDPPTWPAHGTVFGHLVSDTSLDELHTFARAAGIPPQAFDHDHYDVPERRYADLVALGADEVSANELVRRLIASGLRTRTPERTPKRATAHTALVQRWDALMPAEPGFGLELIERWSSEGRHYHDVRHLLATLEALDALGSTDPLVALAAWFHDVVYEGNPGTDEEESAELAEAALPVLDLTPTEVEEVARLVRLTTDHNPAPNDAPGRELCDADLAILGAAPGRYHVYARDVRLEWGHIGEADFAAGRASFLRGMLARDTIFHTDAGRALWEQAARRNLAEELAAWERIASA